MKKVSVIIPAFNKAQLTERTIESVLNQTYKNIEIILVDDGSTDNTYKLKNKYKNKLSYFYLNNKGACSARNYGMKKAKGDYIAHIDCDDIYYPNKILKSVNLLEKNNKYGFIYTDVNLIDNQSNIFKHTINNNSHPKSGFIARKIILSDFTITNSTLVARKECFQIVGGFDENIFIAADREMLIRIARKFQAGYINEKLTGYNIHDETIYKKLDLAMNEFLYVIDKYKNTELIPNNKFYLKCYSNVYYNFAKLYASENNLQKSRLLLLKTLNNNFFNSKLPKIILGYFLSFVFPRFFHKYFLFYRN